MLVFGPSVIYKIIQTNGEEYTIDSPSKMPDRTKLKEIHEPMSKVEITTLKSLLVDAWIYVKTQEENI